MNSDVPNPYSIHLPKSMNRIYILIVGLALAFAAPLTGQSSAPGSAVFMTATGKSQGLIRGEVTQRGREYQHSLLAYSHEIVTPRDAASGLPSGKRQHQPFRIVKLINQGSPRLMTAMTSNELLSTVVVDVWSPTATGAETKMLSYTLTNARIVSLRPWMPNRSDAAAVNYPPAEEIAFVYESIKVTFHNGGIESVDGWNGSLP